MWEKQNKNAKLGVALPRTSEAGFTTAKSAQRLSGATWETQCICNSAVKHKLLVRMLSIIDEGFVCPVSHHNFHSITCESEKRFYKRKLLPGDSCTFPEQCASYPYIWESSCEEGVCNGQVLNAKCSKDAHCDVDLFCKNGKCKTTLQVGQVSFS